MLTIVRTSNSKLIKNSAVRMKAIIIADLYLRALTRAFFFGGTNTLSLPALTLHGASESVSFKVRC